MALGLLLVLGAVGWADEPAYTILADFEDNSVAAAITEARNVLAGDCRVERTNIPARGQGALALEIGATARRVEVACDLTFREPVRFQQADRVAVFCWINEGEIGLAFRVRDAGGRVFETPARPLRDTRRWAHIDADLGPGQMRCPDGAGQPEYPIEIQGLRVTTTRLGTQTVYLDELQVRHRVRPRELVRGSFAFDQPTRIYEPGALVSAAVILENRSREQALSISVDLAWTRLDGSTFQRQTAQVALPASGVDFRSHRRLDFSQRISAPGLYRLVARARAPGWSAAKTVETTIAVTPSNRRLSRGRSTFFGVRGNLLREPAIDQMLEIDVARDLGVNLLAIDAPWPLIEPKRGAFDFDPLDPLIAALSQKDMAAMLVITGHPEWLAADSPTRLDRLAELIGALSRRFGQRLQRFQIDATALRPRDMADSLRGIRALREQVRRAWPEVELFPPAIDAGDAALASELADLDHALLDLPLVFETCGDSPICLEQLEDFRRRAGLRWRASYMWQHTAEPLVGAGRDSDAEAVLRHYVAAATAGVGGLIWSDLRDDDNDPARHDALRGLIRRDFSPKISLLGYAAGAGMLTGYRCAGRVAGTPSEFDSALFIGTNQQVAVLLPRPNRVLPAALAPASEVTGEFSALDFERREHPVLASSWPPLVPSSSRPLFILLQFKQAQSLPRLTLTRPWLRVPATIFSGTDTEFVLELDMVTRPRSGYAQLRLPSDAGVDSSLSAVALNAEAGQTVRRAVRLSPKAGADSAAFELTLRLALDGDVLELPLAVRGLHQVRPAPGGAVPRDPAFLVGELRAPAGQRPTAKAALYCAYDRTSLRLALVVEDDALVPYSVQADGDETGDQIMIGIAAQAADRALHARVGPADQSPAPRPCFQTMPADLSDWRCRLEPRPDGTRTYTIAIPAESLGHGGLRPGQYFRLAARYVDDDADGFQPVPLEWGTGLGRGGATDGYEWLVLSGDLGR